MDFMEFKHSRAQDAARCGLEALALTGSWPEFGPRVGTADPDNLPQSMALDLEAVAGAVVASFRANSHINNVMTHISGARWDHIESALRSILDPAARPVSFSRLEGNIVELICAERGVTGRILKPYLHSVLTRILPLASAVHLQAHILSLHEAAASSADGAPGSAPDAGATGAAR